MGQTLGSSRVINPILTTVVQGYQNNELVGDKLFPVVDVPQRGGTVIEFGREAFRRYNTKRAPGSATKRIQVGYSGKAYGLVDHGLEGIVPWENMEEAAAVPSIDMSSIAVNTVMDSLMLEREIEQAEIALADANYDADHKVALTGTDKWSDYDNSAPQDNVNAGREAIRQSIGRYPNTYVIGAAVFAKLKEHPRYADKLKYTDRDSITPEMLARAMDIENLFIGTAVYWDEVTQKNVDVWGKHAVLAYVPKARGTLRDRGIPSYGYTYNLRGYPLVKKAYEDNNANSMVYPVRLASQPVLCGMSAGYLLRDVVA